MRGLPTYPDAIEWLETHWTPRDVPIRLHTIGSEGWGPFFAVPFQRYLDARPNDLGVVTESRLCRHIRLEGANEWLCPDCHGMGVYDETGQRYRQPMWRAMVRLAAFDRTHPPRPGLPSMAACIIGLVEYEFDGRALARLLPSTERGQWELAEPLFILAINRLRENYEQAPIVVGWMDKSQAQQDAETAA